MNLAAWLTSGCVLATLVLSSTAADWPWPQEYQEQTTTPEDPYIQELMAEPFRDDEWKAYILKYKYLNVGGGDLTNPSPSDYAMAIKMFQRDAGLPETGGIDEDTLKWMRYPRCGVALTVNTLNSRRKRYAVFGPRWGSPRLTYRVSRYTPDLPLGEVDRIVKDAFDIWSKVSPLTFEQRPSGTVDMDIQFSPRSHGDGNNFDGRGGTLAHAFSPSRGLGGDTHFDEDEIWTDRQSRGVNLLQVAVHEFGHALGLAHSNVRTAVMAAFYRGYIPNFGLHPDDIAGIQSLYGRPVVNPSSTPRPTLRPTPRPTQRPPWPTEVPRPTSKPDPTNCRGQFDAVASAKLGGNREFTFAFKDSNVYIIYSTDQGPPQEGNIQQLFGTNIYRVDAAIALARSYTSANLYLFEGGSIYHYTVTVRYDGRNMEISRGSTLRTSQALRGLPDYIDAITVFRGNIYAFKGNVYYRIAGNQVANGYPRPLSVWGLPVSRVDSVVTWLNGRTYFFSGDQYYRFHTSQLRADAGYPRPIGKWWLQCESANLESSTDLPWEEEMASGQDGITDVKTVLEEEQEGTVGAAGAAHFNNLLLLLSTILSIILLTSRG